MELDIVHTPVLVKEVLSFLEPYRSGIIVDATLGEGGHSLYILENIKPKKLIAIDCDIEILSVARERLSRFDNVSFIYGNFANISKFIEEEGLEGVDAVLFDLGISSFHLDRKERGFSFNIDGPLDMRIDKVSNPITAYRIVNRYSEKMLADIIKTYSDERWAKRIARAIVERRKIKPIETTFELAEIVKAAIPRRFWPKKIHPATRTFQAIRIEVNRELENIKNALYGVFDKLNFRGRIIVISFHSAEDRVVKRIFKRWENESKGKVLTKKPVVADRQEVINNPRARSAKLRVFEKY